MFELYDLYNSIREKPLTWGSIVAILLFIVDKLFKQLFIRYIRNFLHIRDREGVLEHMERLNEIDRKLTLLMKERGIEEWEDAHGSEARWTSSVRRRKVSLRSLQTILTPVRNVTKYIVSGGPNMPTNKLIYLPIIVQLCVIIKEVWGIDIGTDQQNAIAVIVAAAVGIIGAWMDKHKKGKVEDELQYSPERSE